MQPFKFKQFSINQDRCAMQVGTDAVLLGAWATVSHNPNSVLDIGAGTGILALMLAQKTNASNIEAIEIDADAYEQCTENFENTPWSDRLFCYHAALLEFTKEIEDQYDLIVSNPPYFSETSKTKNIAKNTARFQEAMPFEHLLFSVQKLLSLNGIFSVVIPFKEEAYFTALAANYHLQLNRKTLVKGTPHTAIKRVLLEFSFQQKVPETSVLVIETSRHQYTQDYINLTKDFYLKM